jgi:hypothetical protein
VMQWQGLWLPVHSLQPWAVGSPWLLSSFSHGSFTKEAFGFSLCLFNKLHSVLALILHLELCLQSCSLKFFYFTCL